MRRGRGGGEEDDRRKEDEIKMKSTWKRVLSVEVARAKHSCNKDSYCR